MISDNPENALTPIDVVPFGIVIVDAELLPHLLINDEFRKALSPIVLSEEEPSNKNSLKEAQPLNAYFLIFVSSDSSAT